MTEPPTPKPQHGYLPPTSPPHRLLGSGITRCRYSHLESSRHAVVARACRQDEQEASDSGSGSGLSLEDHGVDVVVDHENGYDATESGGDDAGSDDAGGFNTKATPSPMLN